MSRQISDYALTSTKAHAAAGSSASCAALDLGATSPWPTTERFSAKLTLPAVPSLVDAKTIIATFEDSADNSSFAAIPELATITQTGAGGVGAAAATREVQLPPSVRRYVRVTCAVLSAGGDNTAVSFTLELKF